MTQVQHSGEATKAPAAFETQLKAYAYLLEQGLRQYVPAPETRPERLHRAMWHSLEAGGKRIRPVLVLGAYAIYPSKHDPLPAAVAVECIHTYSLIHDDLPAMDDSPLRRGQPSCHIAFDEATAILAGDALLAHAFTLLAESYSATPAIAANLVLLLGKAAGSRHLVGGQMADIEGEGRPLNAEELEFIHLNKTAALITAALQMGVALSEADETVQATVARAGRAMGMAFQIVDDILDATSSAEALGKQTGKDAAREKNTYVNLHGIEASRKHAKEHTREAADALQTLGGNTQFLVDLTHMLEQRLN